MISNISQSIEVWVVWRHHPLIIWGGAVWCSDVIRYDVTGTGSREPGTGNEREIISRVLPVFPAFFPELLYSLGTNNGIMNPTNRSSSDIWIPPIVPLLASNSNPTNRRPFDIWIPPMVSLLWTTNRQPSVARSPFWKNPFYSSFDIGRTCLTCGEFIFEQM
jgi:hypothetical protein